MKYILIATCLFVAIPSFAYESEGGTATQAFAQLKSLVGQWNGSYNGGTFASRFEVVANGKIVREQYKDEFNLYYLDGDRLVATHFCRFGTQPRMVARNFRKI